MSLTSSMLTTRVRRALEAAGIDYSWEYPGFCLITLDQTHAVATGLDGWHYGTMYVTVEDDGEKFVDIDENDDSFESVCDEDVTDPQAIVRHWKHAIEQWRESKKTSAN